MEHLITKLLNDFDDLVGFIGFYKINKQGEIWSCKQHKLLTKQINESGYEFYKLTNGNLTKGFIHRLLAIQYIPNPENKPEIDHIDRNKTNNSLDNLRWVTRIENANNKSTNLSELTEDELIERENQLREYKRLWAKKDRLKKGIEPRKELTEEEKAEKAEEQRQKHNESRRQEFALLTEEEKEEIRKKDRENYHKKEQTQEQKDKAKERAKKQREEIKANPAEMERIREYKRIKAQEKRNKEKESNEPSYYELHKDKIKEKYSTPEYKEARNKRLREKTAAATDL
jgi:hypothetical protein